MKNHKAAYTVWLCFNLFFYGWLHYALVIEVPNNLFVFTLTSTIYFYLICFSWDFLQSHIALSEEINLYDTKKLSVAMTLTELCSEIMQKTPNWILGGALVVFFGRLVLSSWKWLQLGEFPNYSTCKILEVLCSPDTKMIGFNNLLAWIGQADCLLFLMPLFILFYWITSIHPKASQTS